MMASCEEVEMRELLLNILNTEEDCVYLGCFTPLSRDVMFDTYDIEVEIASDLPNIIVTKDYHCVHGPHRGSHYLCMKILNPYSGNVVHQTAYYY